VSALACALCGGDGVDPCGAHGLAQTREGGARACAACTRALNAAFVHSVAPPAEAPATEPAPPPEPRPA